MVDESKSVHSKPVMKTESESKPTLAADIQELLLPEELKTRMFAHQIDGLQWLYGLHFSHPGGILGDDMGLGKTFQVNCLLTGLMRSDRIQRVLIVAPVSVLPSWNRELVQHLAPHVKRVAIEMCNAEMAKKKRVGGRREGAGRKLIHPEGATVPVTVRVPETLIAGIDSLAEQRDQSRSEIVTEAIRGFLDAK